MKSTLTIATILLTGSIFCYSQQFEKITNTPITSASLGSRAATFVDVDNDGLIDVFITNGPSGGQNNSLFINQGNGNFVEQTQDVIVNDNTPSDGATWGDVDNDGDLDLYVVNWYGEDNLFYLNDGTGAFEIVSGKGMPSGGYSETASWADFNGDGYLDIYIANSFNQKNFHLTNNGDGDFTIITSAVNSESNFSRNVNWIDFDNDHDLDLFVSNESVSKNKLYVNNSGEFELYDNGEISTDSESSTGSSWADYDNDGDLDLYVANFGEENSLYRNDGGTFTKISNSGLTDEANYSFGTIWGDVDNDGDLDLFVTDGSFNASIQNANSMYLNNGDGTFTKITDDYIENETGWSFGAAFGDYDQDGFLDLVVARTLNEAQDNLLYNNLGNDNNWINIKCIGTVSNTAAIGTKVRVKAMINGAEVTQMREISSQSGYNCQNSLNVHFGLGDANTITELQIEWASGNTEIFENLEVNEFISFEETIPDDFLRANFKLEKKEYEFGEEVQFKNLSLSDPNQEVTYKWDFDNDGTVDSNDFEPAFVYPTGGTFGVKLSISNANGSDDITRIAYLTVEEVTGLQDAIDASINIFPSPSKDVVNIQSDQKKIDMIKVLSLNGREIMTKSSYGLENNSFTVAIDKMPAGILVVEVHFSDGTIGRQKFIKE